MDEIDRRKSYTADKITNNEMLLGWNDESDKDEETIRGGMGKRFGAGLGNNICHALTLSQRRPESVLCP